MRASLFITAAAVAVVALVGGSASAKSPAPAPKPASKPAPAAPPTSRPAPPAVDPAQQQIAKNGMPTFGNRQGQPTITPIDPLQVPKGGTGVWPGAPAQRRFYARSAPYPKCWTASGAWSGPDDWSGYAHLNGWLSWCSNGFWITYAAGGEYPTNGGWYSISYHNGAWWSGGCAGCQTIQMRDYMLWSWSSPVSLLNNTGTTWLTQTATYTGGYSN